jgi:hypothetical protein
VISTPLRGGVSLIGLVRDDRKRGVIFQQLTCALVNSTILLTDQALSSDGSVSTPGIKTRRSTLGRRFPLPNDSVFPCMRRHFVGHATLDWSTVVR